uniref:Protein YIPF n=1 Tax=Ascaris lumbricoides TaxID=6252 RepID=A0A0M3HTR5_ASCLU
MARKPQEDFNLGATTENISSTNTDFQAAGRIGDRAQLFDSRSDSGGEKGRRSNFFSFKFYQQYFDVDTDQLFDSRSDSGGEKGRRSNFFSFKFYQQYFDVDTDQVASRILNSMVPRLNRNFITDYVQPLPDLYGIFWPFWVCVTLVFTTAIFGNLAKYVEANGDLKNREYEGDFRLVTGASTLIACYVILVPFALYSLLWYRRSEMRYSYLEILCAYGYSLSVFVPVSMLWVIHAQWFRWLLILVSVMLSGTVLLGNVWPAVRSDRNKALALGTVAAVLLLHASLAVSFKEFYFDAAQPARALSSPLPEHSGNSPAITEAIMAGKKDLMAVSDSIMKGGNSSKRAAVYSALDMGDAAFVSKDTEVVELVANMTSKTEMTGRGEKPGSAVIHE